MSQNTNNSSCPSCKHELKQVEDVLGTPYQRCAKSRCLCPCWRYTGYDHLVAIGFKQQSGESVNG